MGFKLELPDIGEGVVEAEVQQWFVKPGDVVQEDQPLVEVMTDKATVTIPSPRRGRVVKLFWEVGQIAKVHAPLVELEAEGAAVAAPPPAQEPAPARPAETSRPDFGPPQPAPAGATALGPQRLPPGKALAAPAVRALARELGVDVNLVPGTGPGGRVTKEDLAAFRGQRNGHARPAQGEPSVPSPATRGARPHAREERSPGTPDERGGGEGASPRAQVHPEGAGAEEERIPLRGVRRRMAENMARSKRTAAHFTFVEQCDVTELVKVKDRIAVAAAEEGVKVTFLPFVVKAVVAALKNHPTLNASFDEERQELVVKRRYDVGIAAATDQGLVVPVVRGADRLSLLDVAREIERLGQASKAGQLHPEDMGRSTFTITSLGALGGVLATPVINWPEVAILGLHRIRPTPVARDGQVVVRDVMNVSVTSDHRVVDGHEAAAFCTEVVRTLEDPGLLFMRMV